MSLPFDARAFFEVFARYNTAVWPAQLVLWLAALAIAVLACSSRPITGRVIAIVLGCLWVWGGAVYHLIFFRTINPAATVFGLAFLLEGGLLVVYGWRGRPRFRWTSDPSGILSGLLVLYAIVLYPVLGHLLGHRYPVLPTMGLPCPTTMLTLGLLGLSETPPPRSLLVIPLLWALMAASAVVQLGMWEDAVLPVAGLVMLAKAVLPSSAPRPHLWRIT